MTTTTTTTMTAERQARPLRRRGLLGAWCGAALLPACAAPTDTSTPPERYIVQARAETGGYAEVGRLVLYSDGRGDLTLTAGGAVADRLRAAWSTVSQRPVLDTKTHASDGMLTGRKVARGAPGYSIAVGDVLSREFGFFLVAGGAP